MEGICESLKFPQGLGPQCEHDRIRLVLNATTYRPQAGVLDSLRVRRECLCNDGDIVTAFLLNLDSSSQSDHTCGSVNGHGVSNMQQLEVRTSADHHDILRMVTRGGHGHFPGNLEFCDRSPDFKLLCMHELEDGVDNDRHTRGSTRYRNDSIDYF